MPQYFHITKNLAEFLDIYLLCVASCFHSQYICSLGLHQEQVQTFHSFKSQNITAIIDQEMGFTGKLCLYFSRVFRWFNHSTYFFYYKSTKICLNHALYLRSISITILYVALYAKQKNTNINFQLSTFTFWYISALLPDIPGAWLDFLCISQIS